MNIIFKALLSLTLCATEILAAESEVTPHKYDDYEPVAGYEIPASSRLTNSRLKDDAPDIISANQRRIITQSLFCVAVQPTKIVSVV